MKPGRLPPYLNKLIHAGCHSSLSQSENRLVVLSNKITLILISIASPFIPFFCVLGFYVLAWLPID